MDNFTSSTSSVTNSSINGGNNENEPNPEMAFKLKKQQLPTKNFMSPTICTANKASVPKKKILGERNETLDIVERPTSFDPKSVKFSVVDGDNAVQKPYDPVNNYLSPRPKFLRYNPNRRRKILAVQGNEESVRSCSSFDAGLPSPGMELRSSGFVDSCSKKESVNMIHNEGEYEEDEEGESQEEEDGEEEEFVEDGFWNLKGILKFLAVVIALIYTTQAICSMDSPTPFHTVESWSNVYGVAGLNFSEAGSCSLMETSLAVGSLKEVEDMVDSIHSVYKDEVVTKEEASDSLQELATLDIDAENDEAQVIDPEMWSKQVEIAASEVIEIREVDDQMLVADSDENDEITEEMEEIYDAEGEREVISEEMEDTNNVETIDEMIKLETFDLNLLGLIGVLMLILTSFVVMYSKLMKSSSPITPTIARAKHEAKKEEIRGFEPSANSSSLIDEEEEKEEALMNSASEEFSHIHAPSVELLGEFVLGESNQATIFSCETKSNHMENNSTGHSVAFTDKTIKKQRRKNVDAMVTPSPVRRSSRLQNRSIKSP